MKKSKLSVVFLSFGWIVSAQANMPLTREQILCWDPSIVIGTIVGAESHDCRLAEDAERYCDRIIRLRIRVDSLLRNGNALQSGKIVEGDARFLNDLPMILDNGEAIAMNGPRGPSLSFPATGKPVDTAEARRILLDKQFIFDLDMTGAGVFSVDAWPMSELEWANATLALPYCKPH